jgi:hypothetical protein
MLSTGGSSMFSGSNLLKALGTYNDYSTQKDMEKRMLAANEQAMSQLQPYAQTGTAANSALQELMGLSGDPNAAMARIQNDPAYQFRMQQGMEGLNRNLAASGSLDSGRAMKAAQEYGQGLAAQEYKDIYNRLADTAGFGAGQSVNLANLMTGRGDIQANRLGSQSNILNQGIASLTGQRYSADDLMRILGGGRLYG